MEEVYISKEQYEKLKKELERLKTEERKRIAERLKTALSYGDISENSEYDEATQAKMRLETQIYELEKILRSAKIIKTNRSQNNKILPGSKFEVLDKTNNKKIIFILVGFGEANPAENKISTESLLGKSFLNKKVGDLVKVETPRGETVYEIKKIFN